MPRLIRTPEEILREEKRDLYYVEFSSVDGIFDERENPPGRAELIAWLEKHAPQCQIEPLGPSERSGWIVGGIHGRIRVDFDAEGLAEFCRVWENPDGMSNDPRFQCMLIRYVDWKRKEDKRELAPPRPHVMQAFGDSIHEFDRLYRELAK